MWHINPMTQEVCSFCVNQACQSSSSPPHLPLYWQCWDLWHQQNGHTEIAEIFSFVQLLWSSVFPVCSNSVCRASSPAFKVPFPPSVSFTKFWSLEEISLPWLFPNNTGLFLCVILFLCVWFYWRLVSRVFPTFEGDLFVFRSQCDRTCALCCSAVCSAEISYTCGIATGQMPGPYALSPSLDTAGNLRASLLFHLPLEDVLAKHCHGPCDIPLHLLL